MYVYGIKIMTFQVYIRSRCKWSCGEGGQCACEHMLDYTNNSENILTLILHSFIRSLFNLIFFQIRPRFSILIFWSKFKNACKNVKFALKYQTIKLWGFSSTPFKNQKSHQLCCSWIISFNHLAVQRWTCPTLIFVHPNHGGAEGEHDQGEENRAV